MTAVFVSKRAAVGEEGYILKTPTCKLPRSFPEITNSFMSGKMNFTWFPATLSSAVAEDELIRLHAMGFKMVFLVIEYVRIWYLFSLYHCVKVVEVGQPLLQGEESQKQTYTQDITLGSEAKIPETLEKLN